VKGLGHHLQDAGVCVESIGKLHYHLDEDPTGFDRRHLPMHIKDGFGMVHMAERKQFPDLTPPRKKGGGLASIVFGAGRVESEHTRYDRKVAELSCEWMLDAAVR